MDDREVRWSDLLRRANCGEGPAYARFLTEVTPVIRGIVAARGTGVRTEAEDIVQDVLLAIHLKRHTWRETDPVSPWLYAIARYKVADAGRRRRVTVPVDELAEVLPDDSAGDPTAARDVGRLLSGIDKRSAAIVRSVGVEGASASEVGARLGMSEGAVRVALHRAMKELRRLAGVSERDGQ